MASGTLNTPDDRDEALRLLERGRAEISAEMRWLRNRVNPKEAIRRGMEHHPALVIGTGVAVGLAATWLLLRRREHFAEKPARHTAQAVFPGARPKGGLVKMLTGQVIHMLMPLVVMPAVEKFLKHRLQQVVRSSSKP